MIWRCYKMDASKNRKTTATITDLFYRIDVMFVFYAEYIKTMEYKDFKSWRNSFKERVYNRCTQIESQKNHDI